MPATPAPQQNHLLAALPAEVQNRIVPYLELAPMPLGKALYESGDALRYVCFPTDSIISLLYVMESGASAEISVVGNEGLVGIALFMGGESTTGRAIVQSAGHAYRLLGKRFKDEVERHGELLQLMLRYTQALLTQMAQTAVCNRHHTIDQQLCRWLLLSLDRLPSNQLTMTQELTGNATGFWNAARRWSCRLAPSCVSRTRLESTCISPSPDSSLVPGERGHWVEISRQLRGLAFSDKD